MNALADLFHRKDINVYKIFKLTLVEASTSFVTSSVAGLVSTVVDVPMDVAISSVLVPAVLSSLVVACSVSSAKVAGCAEIVVIGDIVFSSTVVDVTNSVEAVTGISDFIVDIRSVITDFSVVDTEIIGCKVLTSATDVGIDVGSDEASVVVASVVINL